MTIIRVVGWKTGFSKVQFGFLLRECCGFSLSEGKGHVDSILKGQVVVLTIDQQQSENFIEQASRLGAICELDD